MMKIKKNNTIRFLVSLQDYPLEAIHGAVYVFLNKSYIFLKTQSVKKIEVSLKGKKKLAEKQLEILKGEFLNELLNYTVRINLSKSNKKTREYIVSQALFSTFGDYNIDKEDEVKYEEDPLGIAIPWEDKYGEKQKK